MGFYGILGKQEYLKKRSKLRLGSAFFGISDLGFLPYGVPIKGVIEKGWIFDDFFFMEKWGRSSEGWTAGPMFLPGHVFWRG